MNMLTVNEKSYMKYILSLILKGEMVAFEHMNDQEIGIGTGIIFRAFDKDKMPFDLNKIKEVGFFKRYPSSDSLEFSLTRDIKLVNIRKKDIRVVKLISEKSTMYVDESLLRKVIDMNDIDSYKFKSKGGLNVIVIYKNDKLNALIMPVKVEV